MPSDNFVTGGPSSATDAAGRGIAVPSVTGPGRRAAVPGREAPPGAAVGPVEGRKGGLGGAGGPGVITASQPGDEINVSDSLVLNSRAVDLAKAEARLDRLEGAISLDWGDKDVCWMFDEDQDGSGRPWCQVLFVR